MLQKVNLQKVRDDAEALYREGKLYCSEAVVCSIKQNIDPDLPDALIAAASGFPVGVGRSKCICGAVSGGVIALGYFFGRTEPSNSADEKSIKPITLSNELQESFRKNHNGVLCCSVHTKNLVMGSPEHKDQCVGFTGEIAEKTAEIIIRELNLEKIDG